MKLQGKTAVVTGSGGRIGRAIVQRLADEGVRVAVTDLALESAEAVTAQIRAGGGKASAFKLDVMNSEEVRAAFKAILDEFGVIDILVNNAGGSAGLLKKLSRFHETTEEVWRWVIDLNLNGTLSCIHAVINHMMERKSGSIINLASIAGEVGILDRVDYSAAKGGVIALTRALAMELGPYQVTVNAVSPGMVMAEMNPEEKGTWLGRSGRPEEIAAMIAFLASDDARYITGANHNVDGGRVLGPKGS